MTWIRRATRMTFDRFQSIRAHLRFSAPLTGPQPPPGHFVGHLGKVQDTLDHLRTVSLALFRPSDTICVDEMMVPIKGVALVVCSFEIGACYSVGRDS